MADDVVTNKAAIIERCLARIREEYDGDAANLFDDPTRQDSIILNLQRACQAAIDLAMHAVRAQRLGVPQVSREAFTLLSENGHLPKALSERLERMVGFRNVAIRNYQALDLEIVKAIITRHLMDFERFTERALKADGFRSPSD